MTEPTIAQSLLNPRDMLVLGVVLIAVILTMTSVRRRAQGRRAERGDDVGPATGHREGAAMKRDLEALMVQLEELSRRIGAQIDTRFERLETVIADADKRIASLEAVLRAAKGIPKLDETVGDDEPPPGTEGELTAEAGSDGRPGPNDPDKARIYELADGGKTAVQIAQATGRNTGEVELILALRQRGSSP